MTCECKQMAVTECADCKAKFWTFPLRDEKAVREAISFFLLSHDVKKHKKHAKTIRALERLRERPIR